MPVRRSIHRTGPLVRTVAAAAAVALLAAGCSTGGPADDQGSTPTATAAPAPVDYNPQPYENVAEGGTLRVPGTYSPQGNPFHTNSDLNSSRFWNWYNPVTITFSPTGDVQYNPDYFADVAEEVTDDAQTVTITINKDATFNDGTPIDWRAIETVWKTSNGSDKDYLASAAIGYKGITSVTKGETDKQAVIEFAHPDPWWPGLFTTVLHPELADVDTFNEAYVDQAHPEWGAGPYTIGELDTKTGNVTFVRNDKWWGKKGRLDKRVLVNLEGDAVTNAFRNGELDYASAGDAEGLERLQGVEGTEIRQGGSPFVYKLLLNAKSPALSDIAVRKAIVESVDRAQIAEIQFQGLDYAEPLPGSNYLYSFQEGYEDNVGQAVTYDPEQAAADLEAAGYVAGDDGVREKDGTRLELDYPLLGDDPLEKAWTSALAQQLKAIGVQLDINPTPDSEWNSILEERRFDLFYVGHRSLDPFGAKDLDGFYGSESLDNLTGTGTPEIDERIAEAATISDPVEALKETNAIEREGLQQYGLLPLFSGPSIYGVSEGLANIGGTIFYSPLPETIGWEK
ncbi:ABC transporter family substrate-binding protein [Promicromonospora sp. NPDC059942]|uniref:ABC transporter family substrate-binding protein n=1 Tax=Promicromonospora sp. NPDC059942 TaxID=3347009 RepID=UPI003660899B